MFDKMPLISKSVVVMNVYAVTSNALRSQYKKITHKSCSKCSYFCPACSHFFASLA